MNNLKEFLKRKDIEFSAKRYLNDALSAMALGLFASLLIGLIIKTLGEQTAILFGENTISAFFVQTGGFAMKMMGPAIGAAVANGLKSPPLVLFASIISGYVGAEMGGPAGAFIAVAIGAEFGKAVSKETKVDIIVTPAVSIIMGVLAAKLFGPAVAALMTGLGKIIMNATELQPFLMGIIVSVIVGLVLTAPISSAALCIMLDLGGIAAGAATVGCCAQMVGFAVISFKENGVGGLIAQGIGTSMLQVSNIIKNPWILVPPTLAAAIIGPISTVIFKMTNIAAGAGMGTCGFVGQIGTFTSMGFSIKVLLFILLLHFILPAIAALIIDYGMKKIGMIKVGDYKLDL
ncbi:PTS transporter subunit IIC [Anaerovorax odorimutans]|uniref:PTS transporter subunit IIC n=1 Tax=Anaerovorax odorimutans TaxID=109327 RepID=UPI000407C3D2|nr:PTS sugar transporter subunit IIC [Anaerovorax odorimutans]